MRAGTIRILAEVYKVSALRRVAVAAEDALDAAAKVRDEANVTYQRALDEHLKAGVDLIDLIGDTEPEDLR